MAREHVPPHKWSLGKNGRHPGYWRTSRKKGKKLKTGKTYMMKEVRDEHGFFRGWRRVKR